MEWHASGILLSIRPHGEHAAILDVLTQDHGRHAGVMRGGQSRKHAAMLQPGNQLDLRWRARLEEHVGSFTAELERDRAAAMLGDRLTLSGLAATCGLLAYALPERMAVPDIFERTQQMLDVMPVTTAWPLLYLHWEKQFLQDMGFALDLSECAVTGRRDGLAYVSPKSGRAVSEDGAGEWRDRLLPLPPCLLGRGEASNAEIALALRTTGYFLEKTLTPQWRGQPFPVSRERLVGLLERSV